MPTTDAQDPALPQGPPSPPLYEIRRAGGNKGLGVFATQDIPRGTCVLRETHYFTVARNTDPTASATRKVVAVCEALVAQGIFRHRMPLLRNLKPRIDTRNDLIVRNAISLFLNNLMVNKGLPRHDLDYNIDYFVKLYAIFQNNGYRELWEGHLSDTYVFLDGSRINHDCSPSCSRWLDSATKQLTVYALKDIKAGDEITVAYIESPGLLAEERAWRLSDRYDIRRCACAMCRDRAVTDPLHSELSEKYWAASYILYPAELREEEDEDFHVAETPQEALECCLRTIELLEHPAMDLSGMTKYLT